MPRPKSSHEDLTFSEAPGLLLSLLVFFLSLFSPHPQDVPVWKDTSSPPAGGAEGALSGCSVSSKLSHYS